MLGSLSERRLWVLCVGYVVGIFASAYFIQFLFTALRDRGWLRATLIGLFVVVGAVITAWIVRSRPRPGEGWVLLAALLVYGALFRHLEIIQERVHLVQYGVFAGLLLLALEARRDRTGHGRPYLGAILGSAVVGWADELLQGWLPNRTYDIRDVALNALSGALLIAFVAARRRVRRSVSEEEPPSRPVVP